MKGIVFHDTAGGFLRKSNLLRRSFMVILARARAADPNVPQIRFHDLRHTCATMLFEQNIAVKKVSMLLGHSSVQVTLDRYTHFIPELTDELSSVMEAALC